MSDNQDTIKIDESESQEIPPQKRAGSGLISTQGMLFPNLGLYLLAFSVVFGFLYLTGALMTKELPQSNKEVLLVLFGSISTGFGNVLSYFFGSSKEKK